MVAFSQSRRSAPFNGPRHLFQTELAAELAENHREWLYAHCDIFRRMTDARIENRLALRSTAEETNGDAPPVDTPLRDTSHVFDASHSTDDENETTIAISRRDPKLMIAASNDIVSTTARAYVTTDAGSSWRTYRLPAVKDNDAIALGDPQLISDENGEFYYAFLIDAIDNTNGQFTLSDLMIARSSNGKQWTLGAPVVGNEPLTDPSVNLLEDKEAIAIDRDPKSPYHGRLYIVWTEYLNSTYSDYIAYSDDSAKSWSSPVTLPETGYGFFACIRVGAGGTVFIGVSGHEYTVADNALYVSHDGGQTFDVRTAWSYTEFPVSAGYPRLKGDQFRSFPYFAFDVGDSNKLTAAFGTYENDAYAALYLETSTDEGLTWSDKAAVGSPQLLSVDHYQPWVAFDPVTHETYVNYYSSEEDQDTNILVREHMVNANRPSEPQYIGADLFDPLIIDPFNPFIGDYCESDAYGGTYAAVWTQNRKNATDGDVFVYVSSPIAAPVSVVRPVNASAVSISEPYPNPSSGTIALDICSSEEYEAVLSVFDIAGREVLSRKAHIDPSASNCVLLDVHSQRAGVYRVVISTPTGDVERHGIILK